MPAFEPNYPLMLSVFVFCLISYCVAARATQNAKMTNLAKVAANALAVTSVLGVAASFLTLASLMDYLQ